MVSLISRASNRNVCEKPSNEREMHRTESNIMFAPPKSTNNTKSGEFPQLFRACFTQTQWLPVDDTSWKIILFRYCFESSGWWKKSGEHKQFRILPTDINSVNGGTFDSLLIRTRSRALVALKQKQIQTNSFKSAVSSFEQHFS